MEYIDTSNSIFMQAAAFVAHTNKTVFLTGKAGTGKTTFLKYIRTHSEKKMAVVAPTGVAAINAKGTTIHSFFQLPFGTFVPTQEPTWGNGFQNIYNKSQLLRNQRLRQPQRNLMRSLELLIIDEISMVRADVLDAVDILLRSIRRKPIEPFGGVQMLFIGDMFQLPPVVKREEESLMKPYYKSPFFFDAQVMNEVAILSIELKKIYRQKDNDFIHILENVRNNCCSNSDFELLHERYQPQFSPPSDSGYITLTTHNRKADVINQKELDKLPNQAIELKAIIEKSFPENAYPVDVVLHLKVGAQIMFIKNDKGENRRYFNGKIGKVIKINPKESIITIAFEGEKDTIDLAFETWKNIRYDYDKEKDKINEVELGSFQQYPIRLAWAVTIHKSQGLTFEKAVIDAGQSFAPGQVYVALSRLTSMEGLILHSRIQPNNIMVDERISRFAENKIPDNQLLEVLQQSQLQYAQSLLLQAYDYEDFMETFRLHASSYATKLIPDRNYAFEWAQKLLIPLYKEKETAIKFNAFLHQLFGESPVNYQRVHERNEAATIWFIKDLEEQIINEIKKHLQSQKSKPRTKKYISELEDLLIIADTKIEYLKRSIIITKVLAEKNDLHETLVHLKSIKPARKAEVENENLIKKSKKVEVGTSGKRTLALFLEGKSVDEIASIRHYVPSTIVGHLLPYIKEGIVEIDDFVSQQKLRTISAIVEDNPTATSGIIKELLGSEYTYPEIKVVMAYIQRKTTLIK